MAIAIKRSRYDLWFDLLNTVLLLSICLVVVYPLYFVLIASFSDAQAVLSGKTLFLPVGLNVKSYTMIFKDSRIWTGYANTILYTVCGTLFGLAVTIPAAYALSRPDLLGRGILLKIMVFTMYFSGGLIPTYLVVKKLNLTNTPYVLMVLGSFSVFNLIIARTTFISTIPVELQEAAEMDGCSIIRFFFVMVLPLSKAIVGVIALYYAVEHWNSFFNALIYVSEERLYPLQLILRDLLISSQTLASDTTLDFDSMREMENLAQTIKYGIIVIASVPILALYPFVQKYFVKGVMIGSIKG